ncbi:hypothetical protein U1Q18_027815 [Sarracenia purpurea var. burkii]
MTRKTSKKLDKCISYGEESDGSKQGDEFAHALAAANALDKAGQFVIEYCGEVISSEEAKQRSQAYKARGLKDAYIISLNANYFIDATKKGTLARFINHSCRPNCETRKWTILGEIRVGIFAMQDIYVGTELAYDYNFEWFGGANFRCLCGAPNCSKFLGAKSPAFLAGDVNSGGGVAQNETMRTENKEDLTKERLLRKVEKNEDFPKEQPLRKIEKK